MLLFPRSVLFSFLYGIQYFIILSLIFDVLIGTVLLVFISTGIKIGISFFSSGNFCKLVGLEAVLTVR